MATIKDVARVAGVSTSTVSHVLNQTRYVSDEIQQRVQQAVKQLNYAPSAVARSLKVNTTRTFGMLVTVSSNPFFSELVRAVEHTCFQQGYHLILCNTEGDPQRLHNHLQLLLQRRVDGLLLMCTEAQQQVFADFGGNLPVPTVVMDWGPLHPQLDRIQDNSLFGGYLAAKHLLELGHRHLGCFIGPQDKQPARERWQGFQQAMSEYQLPIRPEWILSGEFDCASGYQAMQQLLQLTERPTGLCIGNDMMAMGALSAAQEAGLRLPQELSIVGYDDIPFARYLSPSLTTIHQDTERLGQTAVALLLQRLQEHHSLEAGQIQQITPHLVVRGSTCAPSERQR